MKHIKIFTVILVAALTLTGCSKNETSTTNSDETSAVAESSVETSSTESTEESSSVPESTTESSLTSTLSTTETSEPEKPKVSDKSKYRTDFDKMLDVLNDFAYLDWAICQPDNPYYKEYADKSQTMIEEEEYNGSTYEIIYYKVTGGNLQTEKQFNSGWTMF